RRALAGQHPSTPLQIIEWLEDTVQGWNQAPTPFVWDGQRLERLLGREVSVRPGRATSPIEMTQ
ncbi:MAG: hypothetical protein M3P51_13000, partial [Chloroflexota bacterium]|nr:hypothetical protein [Chloroflexota bacterium]